MVPLSSYDTKDLCKKCGVSTPCFCKEQEKISQQDFDERFPGLRYSSLAKSNERK